MTSGNDRYRSGAAAAHRRVELYRQALLDAVAVLIRTEDPGWADLLPQGPGDVDAEALAGRVRALRERLGPGRAM